jgi:hypothetical protein
MYNEIEKTIKSFNGNIEEINDSPQTAPSKRIEKIFKDSNEKYNKIFHGVNIVMDIGIETIRSKSKRFDNWIDKLINLGDKNVLE